ncbi:MAG: 30S ribosomal protein S6 [Candidatus Saccharimonadales bacterium]
MRKYEIAVLLHPDLEIDLEKSLKRVESIIESAGGKVEDVNSWGKRKLAYSVKKQDFAIYVFYVVSIDTKNLSQLENGLNITDEIIRHLVVKYEEVAEETVEEDKEKEEKKPKAKSKAGKE